MRDARLWRRHMRRYHEIIAILAKHGLGALIDQVGLAPYLRIPERASPPEAARQERLSIPQRLRVAVEELGPTFIKLAQIISTRPDLIPPAYLRELILLQDRVPPAPWELAKAEIESELGPLDRVFAAFEEQPLAAASLGQVHTARLHSGEEVVVKARRPGIEESVNVDLEILRDLARWAAEHTQWSELYDLPEIIDDFSYILLHEMDYLSEGRNADRFRQNFADETSLYIPKVYWDHTTDRVLTLERIRGIKINDIVALDAAGVDRHQLALKSAGIIIKEVLEDGFFHADPHPGNFLVMDDAVIGAMDFGMVGNVTPWDREHLVRLYVAAVQLDAKELVDELVHVGAASPQIDRTALEREMQKLLAKYHGQPLKEIRARQIVDEVTPIIFRNHLRLPSQWWLLGKTLAMTEGLGMQLDPDFDIFEVSQPYVRKLLWQMLSPRRWGGKVVRGVLDWSELWAELPQRGLRLLDEAEKGLLEQTVKLRRLDEGLDHLDRSTNRLGVSVVLAALLISLVILLASGAGAGAGKWLEVCGLVAVGALGGWLLHSLRRAGS